MKRRAVLLGLALLAPGGNLAAQPTLSAADLAPRIGDVQEVLMETAQQPLAELGIAVGEAGGPRVFDFSRRAEGTVEGGTYTIAVLSPDRAPGHEQYPQADYAVLMQGLEGTTGDTYYFVEETPTGSRVLGFGEGALAGSFSEIFSQASQSGTSAWVDYYPLTFGKKFAPVQIPLDFDMSGVQMSGSMTLEGEVDAWGTVVVPAGSFEALRLHQWGKGSMVLVAAGQDTMRMTEELEQYIWMSPRVGQVAFVQEIKVGLPAEMGIPSTSVTQISRLKSFQSGVTAVLAKTWGQIKAGR